jgi:hypothetical protein
MIHATDPEARRVFITKNGQFQEGIMAFEPSTGETIRILRSPIKNPVFWWLLGLVGLRRIRGWPADRPSMIATNEDLLTEHYFMRPPFKLEIIQDNRWP